jgi:hypothetical protein
MVRHAVRFGIGHIKTATRGPLLPSLFLTNRKMATHAKINVPGAGELNLPVGLFMWVL